MVINRSGTLKWPQKARRRVLALSLTLFLLGTICQSALAQSSGLKRSLAQRDAIDSIAYSPDGKSLASTGGKSVRMWDPQTGAVKRLLKHEASVRAVAYAPNGQWVATGGQQGATLWSLKTGRVIRRFKTSFEVFSVSFSRDSNSLVTASSVSTASIPRQNGPLLVNAPTVGFAVPATYSVPANSNPIFRPITESYGEVQTWNTVTGTSRRMVSGAAAPMSALFTPEGKTVAMQGYGRILLANAQTGTEAGEYTVPDWDGWVRCIAFSRDRKLAAAGASSNGNTVYIWEAATRKMRLGLYHEDVRTMSFTPNGRFLATGAWDGSVCIWHTRTGKLKQTIRHRGAIQSLAFSPDGRTLACGGATNVRLWHFNQNS